MTPHVQASTPQASASLAGAGVVTLRDYQQRLVDGVRASLQSGHRRIMAYLPTGGGKTRVATAVTQMTLSKSKGRVVVLANRKQLVHQFASALRTAGLDVGILQGENTHGLHHRVIVASIDTIHARDCIFDDVALFIVDEATPVQGARSTAACCSAAAERPASACQRRRLAPAWGRSIPSWAASPCSRIWLLGRRCKAS